MPSLFYPAVALVLKHEGGLEDNLNDDNGITNFGISLIFYKALKPDATALDIKNMTIEKARQIYEDCFWSPNKYAEINYQRLANRMLDLSVNMGAKKANSLLQQAINSINAKTLAVDGVIGEHTISCTNAQNPQKLYAALIDMAELEYKEIAQFSDNAQWLQGWLTRLHDTDC